MKIIRETFLGCLETASPGLSRGGGLTAARQGVEQGDCFVFLKGRIRTCNGEVALSVPHPLGKELEGAVRAKKLLELLRLMTQEEIEVGVKGNKLVVSAKGEHSKHVLEAEIGLPFPRVPREWDPLPEDWCEAVEVMGSCIGGNEKGREVLACVHVHPEWIEASDNYQVCRWPSKTGFRHATLLKWDALRHVVKMGVSEFAEEESWVHFRNTDGAVLSTLRYVEEYRDFGTAFEERGTPLELPKSLKETCAKASIFAEGKGMEANVLVSIEEGRLKVAGRAVDAEYERDPRRVNYDGPPVEFMISPIILANIAERHGRCEVTADKLVVDGGKFFYVSCLSVPEEVASRNGHVPEPEPEE